MATGVEMLGQMSEDMQLAGPVSGGNMVVKPNEAPVGAAAMLSKALRREANKGVAGIYELPMPKEPLPEFMQAAQQNVKMQGDPMRGMGPREGLTPFDIANMSGAVEQAGIINFLGRQPEVTVPIRAKSHADAPPTQLAYITDAEKQMLINANMHGSLDGEPNPGPGGVQSLDDYYNLPGGGVGGGSGEQVDSAGASQGGSGSSGGGGGYQSSESVGINPGMAVGGGEGGTGGQVFTSTGTGLDREYKKDEELTEKLTKEKEEKQEQFLNKLEKKYNKSKEQRDAEEEKLKILNKGEEDMTPEDRKRLTELNKIIASFNEVQDKNLMEGLLDKGGKAKDSVIKKLKELGIIGPEIKAIEDLPEKTQKEMFKLLDEFERVEVSPKEAMSPIMATLKHMGAGLEREDGSMTLQGLKKALRALDTGDGASVIESLRKYRPDLHYKAFREPQTSGGLADFAMNKIIDTSGMDRNSQEYKDAKKYNNAIFDARQKTQDDRSKNRPSGFNRPVVIDEDVTDNIQIVEADDQTMPYKGPRTGDVEKDVPLSSRFKTDPTKDVAQFTQTPRTQEDIYKYMTQGTTGEGITLEPFSEYQRRRRKALGLDPLELYG